MDSTVCANEENKKSTHTFHREFPENLPWILIFFNSKWGKNSHECEITNESIWWWRQYQHSIYLLLYSPSHSCFNLSLNLDPAIFVRYSLILIFRRYLIWLAFSIHWCSNLWTPHKTINIISMNSCGFVFISF